MTTYPRERREGGQGFLSLSPRKRRRRTAWHSSTPRCHCHRSLCPLILLFLLLHTLRSGSGSILTCPRRQRSLGSPTSFSDKKETKDHVSFLSSASSIPPFRSSPSHSPPSAPTPSATPHTPSVQKRVLFCVIQRVDCCVFCFVYPPACLPRCVRCSAAPFAEFPGP